MRTLKFRLIRDGEIVGYESHTTDSSLGVGMCVYHKEPDEVNLKHGYPITGGDKWFIFHDKKDQFTGFFDRRGKEIYESDIVTIENGWTFNDDNQPWLKYLVVAWDSKCARWYLLAPQVSSWTDIMLYMDKGLEVVGNIYKNKKLLTKKGAKR